MPIMMQLESFKTNYLEFFEANFENAPRNPTLAPSPDSTEAQCVEYMNKNVSMLSNSVVSFFDLVHNRITLLHKGAEKLKGENDILLVRNQDMVKEVERKVTLTGRLQAKIFSLMMMMEHESRYYKDDKTEAKS